MTAAVGLYFIFPGICILSLKPMLQVDGFTEQLEHVNPALPSPLQSRDGGQWNSSARGSSGKWVVLLAPTRYSPSYPL
ncbi:hypothetical protein STEG23_031886 [Scotinomys teguina]